MCPNDTAFHAIEKVVELGFRSTQVWFLRARRRFSRAARLPPRREVGARIDFAARREHRPPMGLWALHALCLFRYEMKNRDESGDLRTPACLAS